MFGGRMKPLVTFTFVLDDLHHRCTQSFLPRVAVQRRRGRGRGRRGGRRRRGRRRGGRRQRRSSGRDGGSRKIRQAFDKTADNGVLHQLTLFVQLRRHEIALDQQQLGRVFDVLFQLLFVDLGLQQSQSYLFLLDLVDFFRFHAVQHERRRAVEVVPGLPQGVQHHVFFRKTLGFQFCHRAPFVLLGHTLVGRWQGRWGWFKLLGQELLDALLVG